MLISHLPKKTADEEGSLIEDKLNINVPLLGLDGDAHLSSSSAKGEEYEWHVL